MKKLTFLLMLVFGLSFLSSCTTVEPGHKGLEIEWGGKTNMDKVYPEGMDIGLHWMWDEMVEYDVREKTIVQTFQFNDKNNMLTGIEVAVDYNLDPQHLPLLHTKIKDFETKIAKTIKSASKEVVPQYTASELNLSKRNEAEQKLSEILSKEFPEFYIQFARVQLTDVDIPKPIADAAEATAKQLEVNKLEAEKVNAAKSRFDAAEFDAKTKDILSQPKMLELYRAETERVWAEKGVSPWGNNNVFGFDPRGNSMILNRK